MKAILIYIFSILVASLQAQQVKLIANTNVSSYRGLSVVSDHVVWISGTKGTVGKSWDGGKTFTFTLVKGHESFDFRDIEGFDSLNAVIMGSGSPAHFLRTNDGGITWNMTYKNDKKEIFFDGMDFWDNKRGIAFSDPVGGKIFMIETYDGGQNWKPLPGQMLPSVVDSEAGFAASGSGIRCLKGGVIVFGTGGKQAHIFISKDFGRSWSRKTTPMAQGNPSSGIFSLAFVTAETGIIVGGDYMADSLGINNCYLTNNGGTHWKKPTKGPLGYRSCIEQIDKNNYICTGTKGTDFSSNKGAAWKAISSEGFNTVKKSKSGKLVMFVGGKGKIGILVP